MCDDVMALWYLPSSPRWHEADLLSDAARGAEGHHPAWHPAFASPAPPAAPLLVPALVAAVNEPANGITATCPYPADGIF